MFINTQATGVEFQAAEANDAAIQVSFFLSILFYLNIILIQIIFALNINEVFVLFSFNKLFWN